MSEGAAKKSATTASAPKTLEAVVGREEDVELPADIVGADAAEIRARARQLENAVRQAKQTQKRLLGEVKREVSFFAAFFSSSLLPPLSLCLGRSSRSTRTRRRSSSTSSCRTSWATW